MRNRNPTAPYIEKEPARVWQELRDYAKNSPVFAKKRVSADIHLKTENCVQGRNGLRFVVCAHGESCFLFLERVQFVCMSER